MRVLLRGCSEFKETEVERVLSAELSADTLPPTVSEPTWVIVHCKGSRAVVEVHDPVSRKAVQRAFDFGASPARGRARLVAIAAAELVLASWAELAVLPPLRVEPEGAPPESKRKRAVLARIEGPARRSTLLLGTDPERSRREIGADGAPILHGDYSSERLPARTVSRLVLLGTSRGFLTERGFMIGGGLRYGTDLSPLHGYTLDVMYEGGTIGQKTRAVEAESSTLGSALYFVLDWGRMVTLRGGAGLRMGLLRSRREGQSGPVNRAVFWGWPMATTSMSLALRGAVVEVSAEGGYVSLAVSPGRAGSTLSGVWLSSHIGIGLRL